MSDSRGRQTSDRPPQDGDSRPGPRPPEEPEGRNGILMGRPFGVPVYVTPSWFVIAALITWVFGGQLENVLPGLGANRYLVAFFFAVAFYGSVLIHELAHTVVALRYRLGVRRIRLQFLGGVSEIEKEAESPWREFWLAFVGPLLSLLLGGVFYLAVQAVELSSVPGVLLTGLMISNLVVAAFNLLPGLPLDGGRMLRAVVWAVTGRADDRHRRRRLGRPRAGRRRPDRPAAARRRPRRRPDHHRHPDRRRAGRRPGRDHLERRRMLYVQQARLKEVLPDLRLRDLVRRGVEVSADTPLGEALRRVREQQAGAVVVVDGRGDPIGLVRESQVREVPEHRRPWIAVGALARDLEPGLRLPVELAA